MKNLALDVVNEIQNDRAALIGVHAIMLRLKQKIRMGVPLNIDTNRSFVQEDLEETVSVGQSNNSNLLIQGGARKGTEGDSTQRQDNETLVSRELSLEMRQPVCALTKLNPSARNTRRFQSKNERARMHMRDHSTKRKRVVGTLSQPNEDGGST